MARRSAPARVFGPPDEGDDEGLPHGLFRRGLVVDDDDQVRYLLCRVLKRWGIAVRGTRDLTEARAALEVPPDLVLVDLWLPDGSGVALAREAAAIRPRPLVIGISGHASPNQTFALGRAGVRAFLVKPFSECQLGEAVRSALVEHETDEVRAGRGRVLSEITQTALRAALGGFCEHHALTSRQRQVVAELVKGTPRSMLARALGVSENSCKTDIRRVLAHCGLARTSDVPAAVLEHARFSPAVKTAPTSRVGR